MYEEVEKAFPIEVKWKLITSQKKKYKDVYFIAHQDGKKLRWIGKAYEGMHKEAQLMVRANQFYKGLQDLLSYVRRQEANKGNITFIPTHLLTKLDKLVNFEER